MNDHSVRGRETGDGCEMEGVWRRERDWGEGRESWRRSVLSEGREREEEGERD